MRRKKTMNSKVLVTLLGLSLLFSACSSAGNATPATPEAAPTTIVDTAIIAEGRLEPIHFAEIAFTTSGVVREVLVAEGQSVEQGQPLIRLGGESDATFAAAQLDLVTAEQAINDLQDASGTDLAQAVIDLKEAREEYEDALDYLDYLNDASKIPQTETRRFLVQTWKGYEYRTKTKTFKGPAPQDWIIEAENDLALKKAQLDAVQRTYDRLKDGVDVEQLALLEAQLNAAKARLAALEVIAPFDGVVANLPAKVGGSINAGEVAVTVADFSSWLVKTTDLTEIDVVSLAEGEPVLIKLDALPEIELKGEILSIGQTYAENQGDVVYEITVLLSDTHPAMRWGMTTSVLFDDDD
jgi:HlyD family secretion protein